MRKRKVWQVWKIPGKDGRKNKKKELKEWKHLTKSATFRTKEAIPEQ